MPINIKRMLDPNETYVRIQSIRIDNLEQQIKILQIKLERIREEMLSQSDEVRLDNLMERLNELSCTLIEFRNRYNHMLQSKFQKNENENELSWNDKQIKSYKREKTGHDEIVSDSENFKNIEKQESQMNEQKPKLTDIRKESNNSFKACKDFMDDKKAPGSILGNYLLRLQDFRTDPELRLQRLERKHEEKLKQIQRRKRSHELLKGSVDNVTKESYSSPSSAATAVVKNDIDKEVNENTSSDLFPNLPVIENNLSEFVYRTINDIGTDVVALTIVQENDHLYHISVSQISNVRRLTCFLATEEAVQEAERQHLFKDLLTFFVVNAQNSNSQKDRILGHLFEFINMDI